MTVRRARLRTALAKGLRPRVGVPPAGRLRAGADARGRTVAGATRSVAAGTLIVDLKFTASAKRRLRRARRLRLVVTVRLTGGATARRAITLRR